MHKAKKKKLRKNKTILTWFRLVGSGRSKITLFKESDTFTKAEIKAITPWRDDLIRRLLLASRSANQGTAQATPANRKEKTDKSTRKYKTRNTGAILRYIYVYIAMLKKEGKWGGGFKEEKKCQI